MDMYKLESLKRLQLDTFVVNHYTNSKLTDENFAKEASKELGEDISMSNIQYIRRVYKIPANHRGGRKSIRSDLAADLVADLMSRLTSLEERVKQLEAK